jgi:hypothetical protein
MKLVLSSWSRTGCTAGLRANARSGRWRRYSSTHEGPTTGRGRRRVVVVPSPREPVLLLPQQ